MSIVSLAVVIIVVGLIVWAVNALIPLPLFYKNAVNVLAVVFIVLYILQAFGLIHRVVLLR